MTGLFNAGRQADALEVYARTRGCWPTSWAWTRPGGCAD
jgi:hypothetical protein